MATYDEIRDLLARVLKDLDAVHDYYVYTKLAWRTIVQSTQVEGRRLRYLNPITGNEVNENAIAALSQHYVKNYLARSTLEEFVALLEEFMSGLMRVWLAAFPGSLAKKEVRFGVILSARDRDSIIQEVIDAEIHALLYKKVADWFDYLNHTAKLGCPSSEEVGRIAEIKATRDVFVHNKGLANSVYVQKAGQFARFRAGDPVEISEEYHEQSWRLLRKVVQDLAEAALAKS